MPRFQDLLNRYPLISDQVDKTEVAVILRELEQVLASNVYGGVVEMGCYAGTTSLFIRRLLNLLDTNREFHVYDSFAGLPPKTAADNSPAGEQYQAGELMAHRDQLVNNFKKAGLAVPIIHKGWFKDLNAQDLPEAVAFAFLDGDFYDSIKTSLKLVGPKLSVGSIVIVDDYQSEALPGVAKAVDEYLTQHPMRLRVETSLAILG